MNRVRRARQRLRGGVNGFIEHRPGVAARQGERGISLPTGVRGRNVIGYHPARESVG